jgi:hypothetical protein
MFTSALLDRIRPRAGPGRGLDPSPGRTGLGPGSGRAEPGPGRGRVAPGIWGLVFW